MADIELVIKIPEEIYNSACASNNIWDMRMTGFVCSAIANGTPLDNIKTELISEYNSHTSEWSYCAGLQKAIELLDRKGAIRNDT